MNHLRRSVNSVRSALIEPRLTGEDERRREYILNIILLGSIVFLWLLDASIVYYAIYEGSGYRGISFELFSLLPIFFSCLLVLSRRGFVRLASYLLIAAYFLSNSYGAYTWGANLQVVVLVYAFIILVASILVNTRFGFLAATAISVFVVPLWYAQYHAYLTTLDQRPSVSDGIIFAIIYFLIMIVAWLSNREIENSLRRARTSEQALKEQFEKVVTVHRFAEFGQLASGLFHDLINLLMVIMPNAPDDAGVLQERINEFVEGMRHELQREAIEESFSLNESVERAIQLLSYKARRAQVDVIFDPADPLIGYGYPFRFHHVVVNLISNAIESYRDVRRPKRVDRVVHVALALRGGFIALSVRDNGSGIPEHLHGKIFEPFFTTKEGEEGIGIGLSLVKKMVEESFGGTVTVESVAGEGSTFIVTFLLSNKAG